MTYKSNHFLESSRAVFRIVLVCHLIALVGCQGGVVSVKPVFRAGAITGLGLEGPAKERGKEYFAAGSFGLAVKHFRIAVAVNPASIGALNGLAASYDQIGRYDLAERHYRRALVINPGSLQTLNNLGFSNYLQGRFDLAIAYLSAASAVGQDNEIVATNRLLASVGQASVTAAADKATSTVRPSVVSADEASGSDSARSAIHIQRTSPAIQTLFTKPELERVSTGAAVIGRGAGNLLSTFRPWPTAVHLSTGTGRSKTVSSLRRMTNSSVVKLGPRSNALSDPTRPILIADWVRSGDRATASSRPITITTELRREIARNAIIAVEPGTVVREFVTQPLEHDGSESRASSK